MKSNKEWINKCISKFNEIIKEEYAKDKQIRSVVSPRDNVVRLKNGMASTVPGCPKDIDILVWTIIYNRFKFIYEIYS